MGPHLRPDAVVGVVSRHSARRMRVARGSFVARVCSEIARTTAGVRGERAARAAGRVDERGGRARSATIVRRASASETSSTTTTTMVLPFVEDRYGGVIVDDAMFDAEELLGGDPVAFARALDGSVEAWRARGTRGVWLKVALERAAHVPVATSRGFVFHHAEKEYVMLTKWLPEDEASTIPANASHQVGVGAFVLDKETRRVLLVQELRGPAANRDLWKMPTGLLEAGEDVPIAAMREVMEETGIDTEFDTVIGCRHAHVGAFGKSDMFFCVGLVVKDGASREITIQPQEIAKAKWATMEEFLDNPHIEQGSHAWQLHGLCEKWANDEYVGIRANKLPLGFGRPGEVYTYVAHE